MRSLLPTLSVWGRRGVHNRLTPPTSKGTEGEENGKINQTCWNSNYHPEAFTFGITVQFHRAMDTPPRMPPTKTSHSPNLQNRSDFALLLNAAGSTRRPLCSPNRPVPPPPVPVPAGRPRSRAGGTALSKGPQLQPPLLNPPRSAPLPVPASELGLATHPRINP